MKTIKICFVCVFTCFVASLSAQQTDSTNSQEKSSKSLKIALIGAHDPKYDPVGKYSHLNKEAYALKHGYDACLYTEYLDETRIGYWYKVVATKMNLENYDWLLYLDSDALIMNDTIKLETLIDDDYDMIATSEGGPHAPILSGQFLIKNTKWSKKFLEDWYAVGDTHIPPGYDNGALIKLFTENEDLRNHIKIIPIRKMGSYVWNYEDGDFAIQFAGIIFSEKEKYIKEYYEKSLTPVK
jgi:hypothetical protein